MVVVLCAIWFDLALREVRPQNSISAMEDHRSSTSDTLVSDVVGRGGRTWTQESRIGVNCAAASAWVVESTTSSISKLAAGLGSGMHISSARSRDHGAARARREMQVQASVPGPLRHPSPVFGASPWHNKVLNWSRQCVSQPRPESVFSRAFMASRHAPRE